MRGRCTAISGSLGWKDYCMMPKTWRQTRSRVSRVSFHRAHLQTLYSNLFIIYVPANCTGQFQPADVGLQRVINHHLRQESLNFHVAEYTRLIESGLKAECR